jgi:hypothetical protein
MNAQRNESDPLWRFERCKQPATIFSPPHIMRQAYFLISDEMARTGNLKISAGAMQTLMDGIDTKLDDQRSLANYITGLLVFLGLIGTFVGLMVTLASVGKIIGELDLSGGGGTEVIQRLMNNLKTPLQGMATGFSSSLFGLITSLALGLIVRFQNLAASSLKLAFEAWLSSVVHITDDAGAGGRARGADGGSLNMQHLRLMYNVAKFSLTATNRNSRTLESLASAVTDLSREASRQNDTTASLASMMEKNAQYQSLMSYHLGRTAKALASHDDIALKLREIDLAINARIDDLAGSVARAAGNIESLSEEIIALGAADEKRLDEEFEQMMGQLDEAIGVGREQMAMERQLAMAANGGPAPLVGGFAKGEGPANGPSSAFTAMGESGDDPLDIYDLHVPRPDDEFEASADGAARGMQENLRAILAGKSGDKRGRG